MLKATSMRYVFALFFVAAVLTAPAPAGADGKPFERPVGSVVITGELEDRVFLTFEQFEALALQLHTLTVTFQAGQAVEQHTFTGFLLIDVLNLLKPQFDPDVKNDRLGFYVSATGTDDYQAIVAWGEFDPGFENKQIMLAVHPRREYAGSRGRAPRGTQRHPRRTVRVPRRHGEARPGAAAGVPSTQLLVAPLALAEVLRDKRRRPSPGRYDR